MAGYGDDAGFSAWLAENGYEVPDGSPAPAVLRQRGSTYVDGTYEPRLPGYRTGGVEQERAWPRTGAAISGAEIPNDAIPTAWVNASYFAAYAEAMSPGMLAVTVTPSQIVKREKAGEVEAEYFEAADQVRAAVPVLTAVEGLVAPFFWLNLPAVLVV